MPLFARHRRDSLDPLAGGTTARFARRDGYGAGWVNPISGQGSLRDTHVWSDYDPGVRLSSHRIRGMLRSDALAHRICYREGQDALREGFEVRGIVRGVPLEADAEAQKAWAAWFQSLGIHDQTVRASGERRAFGGAAWVLWVEDGRPSDQPIDWHNIRRVSWVKTLRGGSQPLVVPVRWVDSPRSPRHGEPELYNVSFPRGGAGVFHWHRVIPWQGKVIDEETLVANQGWGESVLDQVWTALRNFGQSHQYAAQALQKLSQGVFQSEYLANALEAGNGDAARRRLEDVSLGMGITGEIGIGPNENYGIVGRPISGADALLEKMIEILVMYTDQPEIVLRGKRPGGLSTSADGEFRGWYDYVASQHDPVYTPPLIRLVQIGSRALEGPTGGAPVLDPDIHWHPLWQLTEAERLGNRKTAAEARSIDVASGAVTVDEVRSDPDLDEWYRLGELAPPPEDEAEAMDLDPAEVPSVIPEGEALISAREAAELLGYKGTTAALKFAKSVGALFKLGGRYRVARGLLVEGLRGAKVEEPQEPTPAS